MEPFIQCQLTAHYIMDLYSHSDIVKYLVPSLSSICSNCFIQYLIAVVCSLVLKLTCHYAKISVFIIHILVLLFLLVDDGTTNWNFP